ncbi:MAG: hypothetical protein AAB655_01255 [Patescibacteria group bacterium]
MRERELILKSSPCDTNLYGSGPKTTKEARKEGQKPCPHFELCNGMDGTGFKKGRICVMQMGVQVARSCVRHGASVSQQTSVLRERIRVPQDGFIWSPDRKTFRILTNPEEAIQFAQAFARTVLRSN